MFCKPKKFNVFIYVYMLVISLADFTKTYMLPIILNAVIGFIGHSKLVSWILTAPNKPSDISAWWFSWFIVAGFLIVANIAWWLIAAPTLEESYKAYKHKWEDK